MGKEQTLLIVKPDAVRKNLIGEVLARLEKGGLKVVASKMVHLKEKEAEEFYAIHRERPFYRDLVNFMISGPVVISILEGEGAIAKNREIMGATNPKEAAPGTIRADFADSIDENAVHGSDGPDTARTEIAFFFTPQEICPRLKARDY
ncbi:MAG: Nucleoside diphosphate kinase [Chlamydiae bacterium]|nr:Nucleoside diphosphate kinase [Chlamydiota bacterium]